MKGEKNSVYNELLRPRYLQCPSMYTVSHLKKFVYGKFAIDEDRFNIEIMYKVKTIVLLDHYTLMDVAYIYTWKRDAPMRFYFRVKEMPMSQVKLKRQRKQQQMLQLQQEQHKQQYESEDNVQNVIANVEKLPKLVPLVEIKEEVQEEDEQASVKTDIRQTPLDEQLAKPSTPNNNNNDSLKITLVNKHPALKEQNLPARDNRKMDNIKLKIDLAKQNSVTIINKEIINPTNNDKEWKVKNKKDKEKSKDKSPKTSPSSRRNSKTPSPLTVPPLTIKSERISPLAATPNNEDDKKSQFLKGFALTPIKSQNSPEKSDAEIKSTRPNQLTTNNVLPIVTPATSVKSPTMCLPVFVPPKAISTTATTSLNAKRKLKEGANLLQNKKQKLSMSITQDDYKVKLPRPTPLAATPTFKTPAAPQSTSSKESSKVFAVPQAPVSVMRRTGKMSPAPPGSLTPRPHADEIAAPGNRTPIAKRYQPILPKGAARPNPFANLPPAPSDVSLSLQDIHPDNAKHSNKGSPLKVYGPKTINSASGGSEGLMGPPTRAIGATQYKSKSNNSSQNFWNMAMMNAAKAKGNEAPPGCRTPIYIPQSSPSYSPSSPQYVPNYNIPTMPTYKYTPKAAGSEETSGNNNNNNKNNASYLQSVLAATSTQFATLFPSAPTRRPLEDTSTSAITTATTTNNTATKRAYPFKRSPSPGSGMRNNEDPPEKQLKVKSLLNSCNINIPSSLSITITRDDGESPTAGVSHPKHKSPVNNYIEILKLPEQVPADHRALTKETTITPTTTTNTSNTITNENNRNNNINNKNQQNHSKMPQQTQQHQQQQQQQRASPARANNQQLNNSNNKSNNNLNANKTVTFTSQASKVHAMLPPSVPVVSTTLNTMNNTPTTSITTTNLSKGSVTYGGIQKSQTAPCKPPTPPLGVHNFNNGLNVSQPQAPKQNAATNVNKQTTPKQHLQQNQQQQQQQQQKRPQQQVTNKQPSQQQSTVNKTYAMVTTTSNTNTNTKTTNSTSNTTNITNTTNTNGNSKSNTTSPEKLKTSPVKSVTPPNVDGNKTSPTHNNNQKGSPESGATPSKKFRPILPRQNPTPITEVVPPKVTTGNIIGTYSSPSGVAVKIHATSAKKTNNTSPNSKKTSTSPQQQQNQQQQQQQQQQRSPPTTVSKEFPLNTHTTATTTVNLSTNTTTTTTTARTTPSPTNKNMKRAATPAPKPDVNAKKANTTTNANTTTTNSINVQQHIQQQQQQHQQQQQAMAAVAAFKDNLMRAHAQAQAQAIQMQAAAAAAAHHHMLPPITPTPGMFYAAMQMNQTSPPSMQLAATPTSLTPNNPYGSTPTPTPAALYNFQQAYIMEQLSRIQRAAAANAVPGVATNNNNNVNVNSNNNSTTNNNEMFNDYLQKLKNTVPTITTTMSTLPTTQSSTTTTAAAVLASDKTKKTNNRASPKINNNNTKSTTVNQTTTTAVTTTLPTTALTTTTTTTTNKSLTSNLNKTKVTKTTTTPPPMKSPPPTTTTTPATTTNTTTTAILTVTMQENKKAASPINNNSNNNTNINNKSNINNDAKKSNTNINANNNSGNKNSNHNNNNNNHNGANKQSGTNTIMQTTAKVK